MLVVGALVTIFGFASLNATSGAQTTAPSPLPNQSAVSKALTQGVELKRLPWLIVPLQQLSSDQFNSSSHCIVRFNDPTPTGHRPSNAACTFGDPHATRRIVLFGDSHSSMWFDALNQIAKNLHFSLTTFIRSSCQTASLHLWSRQLHTDGTECTAFRTWALQQITALHPAYVIVSDDEVWPAFGYADLPIPFPVFAAGQRATFRALRAAGAKVIDLGTTPSPKASPGACLPLRSNDVASCSIATSTASAYVAPAAELTAHSSGAAFIDTFPWFCTEKQCPMVANHTVLYADANHVSHHWAMELLPTLERDLQQAGLH
jgi:hypothetical protein